MPPRIRPAWAGAHGGRSGLPGAVHAGGQSRRPCRGDHAPRPVPSWSSTWGDVPDRGYWGEVLTTGALARGLAGLVIDGGVRDVGALESLGFPVFSATIALPGATKRSRGHGGRPTTTVAGVPVGEGDWVVGDVDGVVVVPGRGVGPDPGSRPATGRGRVRLLRRAPRGVDDRRAPRAGRLPHRGRPEGLNTRRGRLRLVEVHRRRRARVGVSDWCSRWARLPSPRWRSRSSGWRRCR